MSSLILPDHNTGRQPQYVTSKIRKALPFNVLSCRVWAQNPKDTIEASGPCTGYTYTGSPKVGVIEPNGIGCAGNGSSAYFSRPISFVPQPAWIGASFVAKGNTSERQIYSLASGTPGTGANLTICNGYLGNPGKINIVYRDKDYGVTLIIVGANVSIGNTYNVLAVFPTNLASDAYVYVNGVKYTTTSSNLTFSSPTTLTTEYIGIIWTYYSSDDTILWTAYGKGRIPELEAKKLSENPYSILEPIRSKLWLPTAATDQTASLNFTSEDSTFDVSTTAISIANAAFTSEDSTVAISSMATVNADLSFTTVDLIFDVSTIATSIGNAAFTSEDSIFSIGSMATSMANIEFINEDSVFSISTLETVIANASFNTIDSSFAVSVTAISLANVGFISEDSTLSISSVSDCIANLPFTTTDSTFNINITDASVVTCAVAFTTTDPVFDISSISTSMAIVAFTSTDSLFNISSIASATVDSSILIPDAVFSIGVAESNTANANITTLDPVFSIDAAENNTVNASFISGDSIFTINIDNLGTQYCDVSFTSEDSIFSAVTAALSSASVSISLDDSVFLINSSNINLSMSIPSPLYKKFRSTATRLLTKYGTNVVITSRTPGIYDVASGSATITESIRTCKGIVFDWGTGNFPDKGEQVIDGTIIKIGDKRLILASSTLVPPEIGDVALVNGTLYTIVPPVKPLSPAGELVIVECNIRGI